MTLGQNKATARLAGSAYLMVVVFGIFSLLYVQSRLFQMDNAQQTLQNITDNMFIFRLGALSGLLCYVFFLLLPLVLYKLLHRVSANAAAIMVVLAVISVPISFASTAHLFDIITLINHQPLLQPNQSTELAALVMLKIRSFSNGIAVSQVFWGLWLFPYGYLVYRSGFLPKIIGVVLMIGSTGYFLDFIGWALMSEYRALGISDWLTLPATIGEIGSCLWLVVMGIRIKASEERN